MLSSMTPSFLETDDRVAVIGTPGGSRIITMVLLGALAFHQGASADEIVNLPRYHHQYLPDKVFLEKQTVKTVDIDKLQHIGHQLSEADDPWGNMQLVIYDKQNKRIDAASDGRGLGSSIIKN